MRITDDNPIAAFDRLVQSYNANQSSRFKRLQSGLPAAGSGADYHYKNEHQYLQLIEMVRDFERNDPIIRGAFNRLTSNVMQNGFTLDPSTGSGEADKRISERWHDWSTNADLCDAAGEQTFPQMECMAFRSMGRDGDCMGVGLSDGTLRWYEAHRMRTPRRTTRNVVHGFLLDEMRRRKEVWVTREEVNPWQSIDLVGDMVRIPIRDEQGHRQAFHVYHPDRFSQTRGIGWAVPVLDTISMHGDMQFARMVQQKVVSCFTVFLKRTADWNPETTTEGAAPTRTDYLNGLQRTLQDLFPGKLIEGMPGEELEGFSPNVPNPEFFQHTLLLLTFIACALDLPLQVLLLDPTKTNFSGWRGAVEQARLRYTQLQALMIERLHKPVYLWKVRQWIRTDEVIQQAALQDGVDVFGHQWNAPGWEYMERLTDAQADTLMLASGLDSPRRLLARRGLRHEIVVDEKVKDRFLELDLQIASCLALNDKYGEKLKAYDLPYVDWHETGSLPLPQGIQLAIGGPAAPADDGEDDAEDSPPAKKPAAKKAAALVGENRILNHEANGHGH